MVPAKIPTASVSREKYVYYWRNAQECFRGMQEAALAERWHLTALDGIHCVIAAADALLVFTVGLRSRSRDHRDVFALLTQHISDPRRDQMIKHGLNVLRQKTEVEYGAKQVSRQQAYGLMKQVERFYYWVQDKIGRSL